MNLTSKTIRRGSLVLLLVLMCMIAGTMAINAPKAPVAQAAGGSGASLPYVEIQAENAVYTGTLIDATQNRTYPGLAVEAIGRRAVTLTGSQYVEFTVPQNANSIVVRYSIPDGNGGAGIDATLGLSINGVAQTPLATTSRYGWIYGGYPFNNNMGDVRPHHFYDEVNRMVGQMSAGTKVRLTGTGTATTVDLIDFEQVAPALSQPANSISLTSYAGVDPSGVGDSTAATQQAINDASAQGRVLWVPPGTYKINTQLHVNNVTIRGAGMWYSKFYFPTQTGNNEGFYGNYAPNPSTNVHLSDFAIWGNVVTRIDNDQINGIGGALTNSTITRLWIEHTKCGLWLDGPFNNLQVSYMRIRNQNADGVNFHKGVTNSTFTQSHFRNTGDDAMAMWSDSNGTTIANANNSFTFNTIEIPVLANGIAIYGGTDINVTDNYVAEQQAEGGGIHVGNRFSPVTPVSGTINILRNTIVRAGSQDYYNGWNFGTGALWFYALDQNLTATINVNDNLILDSNYEAIHFIGNSVSNITFRNNQIVGAGTYAVENRANGGSATFINTTATGLGRGGYFSCAPGFTPVDGGGNTGLSLSPAVCVSPYPTPVYGPVATVTPQFTPTPRPTNTPCPGGICPTATRTPTTPPTATNTPLPTPIQGTVVKAINAGGSATGSWLADTNFDVGNVFSDTSTAIDTSGYLDTNVAPQAVYQTCRWNASFTYTVTGLTANRSYVVLLHWAELSFQTAGARRFNVAINGTTVLSSFDVYATAGFKRALGRAFNATSNGSGQIVIAFTQGGADNPFISGIEIISPTSVPTPTTGPSVTPTRTPTTGPTATTPPGGNGSPWNGTPAAIPGTVQAENFNTGGEGVAYHDLDTANSGGQYRTTEGVDIEATGDTGGGYNVGWMRSGEWMKYTVNVTTAGSYTLNFRAASGAATGAFYLEVDGTNVTGTVAVPNTGGWQTYQTISRTGINLTAGQHLMRLVVSGNDVNLNWFSVSGGTTPTLTPTRTPTTGPTPTRTPTPTGNNGSPWNGTPVNLPGTVQAENFNTGGEGIAYHDLDTANSGGQYRTSEGVDIEGCSDTGCGYNVGWMRSGEWMKYTVNVTSARAYAIDFRVATGVTTSSFYLEVDGVNVTGTITAPNTGGWQTWQTITRTGINLTAGQHVLRLVTTGNDANLNWIQFR